MQGQGSFVAQVRVNVMAQSQKKTQGHGPAVEDLFRLVSPSHAWISISLFFGSHLPYKKTHSGPEPSRVLLKSRPTSGTQPNHAEDST